MPKKHRYKIYIALLFVIIFSIIVKLGFLDRNLIIIDSVIIDKPFLYRSIVSDNSELKENHSKQISFLSLLYNNYASYSIEKKDFNSYKNRIISNFNLEDFDINTCYINIRNEKIDLYSYKFIKIYKYPYYIAFNEINREREDNFIRQICNQNPVTVYQLNQ